MSITPEKRPLPTGSSPATSSRSNEARIHNVGPQRMVMLNPTAGAPHVEFGKDTAFTDPASLHNTPPFPWMVQQVAGDRRVGHGKDHPHPHDGTTGKFLPNLNSMPEAAPVPLAPVTPAKAETNGFVQHGMIKTVTNEPIPCSVQHDPSNPVAHQQGLELPPNSSFSHTTQLDEERINHGRNASSRKKKVTRKKHRPKVLKDSRLTPEKPVTPKQAKPKQTKQKEQPGRSNVRKKKSLNRSSAPPDTTIDDNDASNTGRKHPNQHMENRTKIIRRRLEFHESKAVAEYNNETSESDVMGRYADTGNNSVSKLTTVHIVQCVGAEAEEPEADIAFDLNRPLNQQVLDESITLQECLTPHPRPCRRELLKKNWKCLARQAGNANSSDDCGLGRVSKLQLLKSQLMSDGRTELTSVQGDADSKNYHNHAASKDFLQAQVRSLLELPPECKRRRTMIGFYDREFGRMAPQGSNSSSSADEQEIMPIDSLQTMDFTFAFALTKRAKRRRSKLSRLARKSGFNMSITGCNRLLKSPENPYQGCVGALSPIKVRTGRRTQKRQNHRSISSKYFEHGEQESIGLTSIREDLEGNGLHDLHSIPIQVCRRRSNILERLCTDLTSQAIVPYTMDEYRDAAAESRYALVKHESSMIIPYTGEIKKKHPRAKVDLDDETNRVWNLLMGKMVPDVEGSDADKETRWEEERLIFRGRADAFIQRMRLIQGDRQFSPWKGSVLDSVIGVFLTQNVSDHLSSSVFMSLASKFPVKSKKGYLEQNANKMSTMTEEYQSTQFSPQEKSLDQRIQDDDLNSFAGGGKGVIMERRELKVSPETPNEGKYISVTIPTSNSELQDIRSLDDALGQRTQDDLDIFNSKCVNIERRELEVSHEALERSNICTTITGNPEDKRSLDDAVSSQNSLSLSDIASDITSNSFFQNTNSGGESGAPMLLNTDMSNRTAVDQNYGEIYNQHSNVSMLSENCSAVEQNSEDRRSERQNSNIVHCQEISSASKSQLSISQVDSCGLLQTFVSESSDSHNMENVNVINTEKISGSMFFENENINIDTVAVQRNCRESLKNSSEFSSQQLSPLMSDVMSLETYDIATKESLKSFSFSIEDEPTTRFQQSEGNQDYYVGETQPEVEFLAQKQHCQSQQVFYNSCGDEKRTFSITTKIEPKQKSETCNRLNFPAETSNDTPKTKGRKTASAKAKDFDWDSLRREACNCGYNSARSKDRMDSVDWEAVRQADIREISKTIKDRGMNNVLAERIKGLLNRLVNDHGSLDLEWLRDIPPGKAKEYLLSIQGLGLKSVECVRLLTLHQVAFPVDTNVGRISVRLGWVPLQPLPESLELHLLESYPLLETIQKYLWPRLCTLDLPTLYELHYHMITFGKVFCTKSKPNCNACPMRGGCRHFASAYASSRFALPGPEERSLVESTLPDASENHAGIIINPMPLLQIEEDNSLQGMRNNTEPIIEEPPSPQPECQEVLESEIEEVFYEDPDEIPTIHLNTEEFTQNMQNYMRENTDFEAGDIQKAIFAITKESASIPMPKLKNVRRLRTVHQVYELPDGHPLLEGLEPREYDDPCPYLLSIWIPGETAQSAELPQACCNPQDTGKMCEDMTCFSCNCRREEQSQTIRGTLLIPCRTANRGSFPLNGTYFQVNEVFADHMSSHTPLVIPRKWIWNLPRRFVYFGTSIPTIFRGLLIEEIQLCFSRGFVCIRGFDRKARAPRPLCPRLHLAPSHVPREKRAPGKYKKARPTEDSR